MAIIEALRKRCNQAILMPGDGMAGRIQWRNMAKYWSRGKVNFFRFVFGKAGVVSVGLTEKAGDKIFWLKQEQIPADEPGKYNFHVGCKTGWTFYLANLKCVLQGGPDLRNKNQALEMD